MVKTSFKYKTFIQNFKRSKNKGWIKKLKPLRQKNENFYEKVNIFVYKMNIKEIFNPQEINGFFRVKDCSEIKQNWNFHENLVAVQ